METNFRRGFYKITVHDKDSFGFKNIIGKLDKDVPKSSKGLVFNIGVTYISSTEGSYDILIISPDEAKFEKLLNREVYLKIFKNKERYKKLY